LKGVDLLLGSFATFGGQGLEFRNKDRKRLVFHFSVIKLYRGDAGEILGLVLVVKSGEDLFMSFLKPEIGVFGVFVVYYKAGFEEAVGISF
jgi:hypothetical protein